MKSGSHRAWRQRGAALLMAMIIVTLVSTMAAGMVWQQSRAVNVEAAERQRAQMGALSVAGMNFVRGAVRKGLSGGLTPGKVKDLVLQKVERTPLKSLLAADRNNSLDAEIAASITLSGSDAAARLNLRALVDGEGKIVPAEFNALGRLCEALGLSGVAETLAPALQAAWGRQADGGGALLVPRRVADLAWYGLDARTLDTLKGYVDILPDGLNSSVNLNTAPKEVIYAVIDKLPMSTARQLVRSDTEHFREVAEVEKLLPEGVKLDPQRVALVSRFFYATVVLEYEGLLLEETYLIGYGNPTPSDAKVLRRARSFSKVTPS